MKGPDANTSALIYDKLLTHIYCDNKAAILILKYSLDIDCAYGSVIEKMTQVWSGKRALYLSEYGPITCCVHVTVSPL
jgi:hypothetical protein